MAGFTYAVVGGGMQGRTAAFDLAGRPDTAKVVVLDVSPPRAPSTHPKVEFAKVDVLADPQGLRRALKGADVCLVALPGSIAQRVLQALAEHGPNTIDMSFTPEVYDAGLDSAAQEAGLVMVRDVGVAPGLSHLLAAEAAEALGGLSSLTIYVGGLPQHPPDDPFRHAVYFNPLDLVAEYTRPARMRRGGKPQSPDPLSTDEVERLQDDQLGALEAFPSDGLRTLLDSYPACPEMRELTLRWPGHLDHMRGLAKSGKFSSSAATATASDFQSQFAGEAFPDWLLMEVQAEGPKGTLSSRILVGAESGLTAMSRTTAFTATAAAHALACEGQEETGFYSPGRERAGLFGPEIMGQIPDFKVRVLKDLEQRNIVVYTGGRGARVEGREVPTARLRRA